MWIYSQIGFVSDGRFFSSPILTDEKEEIDKKYPLYNYVPKYSAHLKPGDVLYNPPWWWHEVRNLNESISVPIRVVTIDDLKHLSNILLTLTFPGFKEVVIPLVKTSFTKSSYEDLYLSDQFSQKFYHGKK